MWSWRNLLLVCAVVCAVLVTVGCLPTSPSYTCYTQPRMYVLPDGRTQMEIDYYSSQARCPAVRIQ